MQEANGDKTILYELMKVWRNLERDKDNKIARKQSEATVRSAVVVAQQEVFDSPSFCPCTLNADCVSSYVDKMDKLVEEQS